MALSFARQSRTCTLFRSASRSAQHCTANSSATLRGHLTTGRARAVLRAGGTEGVRTRAVQNGTRVEQPWAFGFQTNERYLSWDQSAQLKLLKLVLAEKMGCSEAEVEARAEQLATLLPDMLTRLECTRVDILMPLMQDLPGLTAQLIGIRECLPGVNVSALAAKHPRLLQDFRDPQLLASRLSELQAALPGVNVPLLVAEEPHLLHVDIQGVLANCRRLMPQVDPVRLLVSQPQMVLTAVEAGLSSAMDVEGGAPATQH